MAVDTRVIALCTSVGVVKLQPLGVLLQESRRRRPSSSSGCGRGAATGVLSRVGAPYSAVHLVHSLAILPLGRRWRASWSARHGAVGGSKGSSVVRVRPGEWPVVLNSSRLRRFEWRSRSSTCRAALFDFDAIRHGSRSEPRELAGARLREAHRRHSTVRALPIGIAGEPRPRALQPARVQRVRGGRRCFRHLASGLMPHRIAATASIPAPPCLCAVPDGPMGVLALTGGVAGRVRLSIGVTRLQPFPPCGC